MKALRLITKPISILLFLGALLCLFLTVLVGGTNTSIMKKFYWLQTDTSKYSGAKFDTTRWTFYGMCDTSNNKNKDCTKSKAAYAFSPKDNFSSTSGLPSAFTKNRKTYYYLSRIGYGLLLAGLFFLVLALIPFLLFLLTGRLRAIAAPLYFLGLFFSLAALVLVTAVYVLGRRKFKNDGVSSKLGVKAFGTSWAGIACLLFNIPSFIRGKKKDDNYSSAHAGSRFNPLGGKNWANKRRARRERELEEDEQSPMHRYSQLNSNGPGGVKFMSLVEQREQQQAGSRRHKLDSDSDDEKMYVATNDAGNKSGNSGTGIFSQFSRSKKQQQAEPRTPVAEENVYEQQPFKKDAESPGNTYNSDTLINHSHY